MSGRTQQDRIKNECTERESRGSIYQWKNSRISLEVVWPCGRSPLEALIWSRSDEDSLIVRAEETQEKSLGA